MNVISDALDRWAEEERHSYIMGMHDLANLSTPETRTWVQYDLFDTLPEQPALAESQFFDEAGAIIASVIN